MAYSLGRSGRGLFTGTAWHYAQYRPGYPKPFFDSIVAQFALDGTDRLLDLGCGTGQLTLPLAEHVTEAVGMDPEPEMLTEAARQAQAARVTNVTWAQGSSEELPGNIGRFKLVTMGRSFHWMNREQVLTVLEGMVDDDGGLVIANDSCLVRPTTAVATSNRGHPEPLPAAGNTDQQHEPGYHPRTARSDPGPLTVPGPAPHNL